MELNSTSGSKRLPEIKCYQLKALPWGQPPLICAPWKRRDYGGFLYLKFTFSNKISAPRFLHLQIAENLPANLAAWAQSINDVQAWLVSFLIQHTSVTASKSFSEQLLKPLLYWRSPYKTLQNQKFRILYIQKSFFDCIHPFTRSDKPHKQYYLDF